MKITKLQKNILFIVVIISILFSIFKVNSGYTNPHFGLKSAVLALLFSSIAPIVIFLISPFELKKSKINIFTSKVNILFFMGLVFIFQGVFPAINMLTHHDKYWMDGLFPVTIGTGLVISSFILNKIFRWE